MKYKVEVTLDHIGLEQAVKISNFTVNWRGHHIHKKASLDEIISFCTDWQYESFVEMHEQIIRLDFPRNTLPVSKAESLLRKLDELEAAENKQHADKIYSEQKLKRWQFILKESKDSLQAVIEAGRKNKEESYPVSNFYYEEEENRFQVELDEVIVEELKWLYKGYRNKISSVHSWEDVIQVIIIQTFPELQMLHGGCRVRIPLHLIGLEGAEELEELFDSWCRVEGRSRADNGTSQKGQDGEELTDLQKKVILMVKKIVHDEAWRVFQKMLERNKENGHKNVIYTQS